MAKATANIALDPELKLSAGELFRELGLDLTTAVTLFLQRAIREQSISFVTEADDKPNPLTMAAISEYEEMKKNPGEYKRYKSFREAMDEVL